MTLKGKIILVISGAVLLVVGIIALFYYLGRSSNPYDFVVAEKGTILQEISVTGRVKPADSLDLAFEVGGKISWIAVDVGGTVSPGQSLISLGDGGVSADLAQAKAGVKIQEANLEKIKKGTRQEEIDIQEVKVLNAEASLEEDRRNLKEKIEDSYTKSDDAIRNNVDQFFSNPKGLRPKLNFNVTNSQLESNIESGKVSIESVLDDWQESLLNLSLSEDLNPHWLKASENLAKVKSFLEIVASAVNALEANASIAQTTIDNYKTDVSTARTNVNIATANLSSARDGVVSAKATLALEGKELKLKIAGATPEDILAQEAKVEEARASVLKYEAELAKLSMFSPIHGIVTKVNVKVGEIISANTIAVSIISRSGFEIEANVLEADIANLDVGDSASLTLDAYGEDVIFNARVVKVDPAETIIDGVSTYKTTLQFDSDDGRIKSGMTADIDIVAASKENVISIPQRAVIFKSGSKLVRILDGESVIEKEVKTGINSSFGNIEILEGVNEGEKVITSLNGK